MEIMAGAVFQLQAPASPQPETDRFGALDALEGRSPVLDMHEQQINIPAGFLPIASAASKRSSWGAPSPSPNSMAMVGGKGASDLGMLLEEEEGSGDEVAEEASLSLSPAPTTRRRPVSLFLPSNPKPQIPNAYGTTSDMPSPSEDDSPIHFPSMTPKRGLRTLSMSTTATSPSPTTSEATKRLGLRSLTLTGPADPTSPTLQTKRRSLISGPSSAASTSSSNANSRVARRSTVSMGPLTAGKRSSIAYRSAASTASASDVGFGFGDLVMEGDFSVRPRIALLSSTGR